MLYDAHAASARAPENPVALLGLIWHRFALETREAELVEGALRLRRGAGPDVRSLARALHAPTAQPLLVLAASSDPDPREAALTALAELSFQLGMAGMDEVDSWVDELLADQGYSLAHLWAWAAPRDLRHARCTACA